MLPTASATPCRARRQAFTTPLSLLLLVIALAGCSRPLRDDATRVALAGSRIGGQMASFYRSLQQDTLDTYELNAFREAYLLRAGYERAAKQAAETGASPPAPPPLEMSETDEQISREYQQTYQALAARVRLAQAIERVYDSFADLSKYDATKGIFDGLDDLIRTAGGAASLSLPDPTRTVTAPVRALFTDLITELTTIQQNRRLLREGARLLSILQKLREVFKAERILYGGDGIAKDGSGNDRQVSGIAGRRAAAYESVARQLVESRAVITTAFLNRVLEPYQLRWPDPEVPFEQPALSAGVIKMIEARAYPLAQLSEDAAGGVYQSLSRLMTLHQQLAARQPLSWREFLEHSATVDVLLDQLNRKVLPAGLLPELLQAIQKGSPP